jgi:ubiquinol-cytochrome c reductase iron-sulfur subunit
MTVEPHEGLSDEERLPDHHPRRSDIDPRAAKRAEHQVGLLFLASALASLGFLIAYVETPIDHSFDIPVLGEINASNLLLGLLLGLALFLIGAAAIHWAKKLMPDVEIVDHRKPEASDDEARDRLLGEYNRGLDASGIKRRPFILGSMAAGLAMVGLPAIILLRDLGPLPGDYFRTTMWDLKKNTRILIAETQQPVKPEDLTVGTLVSCVPEGIDAVMEAEGDQNELAKAAVLLIRMDPSEIIADQTPPGEESWNYQGILCYSKICTHVGCPLGLYEQQTHHMLCPCHQSTFNMADAAEVIFGPAARSLPQLAITVDDEGYLVSRGGFTQPVGPSFWERG